MAYSTSNLSSSSTTAGSWLSVKLVRFPRSLNVGHYICIVLIVMLTPYRQQQQQQQQATINSYNTSPIGGDYGTSQVSFMVSAERAFSAGDCLPLRALMSTRLSRSPMSLRMMRNAGDNLDEMENLIRTHHNCLLKSDRIRFKKSRPYDKIAMSTELSRENGRPSLQLSRATIVMLLNSLYDLMNSMSQVEWNNSKNFRNYQRYLEKMLMKSMTASVEQDDQALSIGPEQHR